MIRRVPRLRWFWFLFQAGFNPPLRFLSGLREYPSVMHEHMLRNQDKPGKHVSLITIYVHYPSYVPMLVYILHRKISNIVIHYETCMYHDVQIYIYIYILIQIKIVCLEEIYIYVCIEDIIYIYIYMYICQFIRFLNIHSLYVCKS